MYRKHQQSKKSEYDFETGTDFCHTHVTKRESEVPYQIQAQREYVNRLKIQREKIQILYDKYDSLLKQMQRKDIKIAQQLRIIDNLQIKVKDSQLIISQVQCLRKQNTQLRYQRQGLKRELTSIDGEFKDVLTQIKLKTKTNEDHRQEVEEINKQLMLKIRKIQQKYKEKENRFDKERNDLKNKIQQLRKQLNNEKNKNLIEIGQIKQQFLKSTQDIHILQNQITRLNQQLVYEKQTKANIYLQNQDKLKKINIQYRLKIKSYKQQLQQLENSNQILSQKIKQLHIKVQQFNKENLNMNNLLSDQKRICQQKVYHIKYQNSQQKTMLRQQNLYLQSKISKLQKQLQDSYRKQKQLVHYIKSYEDKEKIKKNLRQIQKNQLQRINRILLLEK